MNRTFPAKLVRWVDGDTCVVDIDLGFNTWVTDRHVRLSGLDTPEIFRPKTPHEKILGHRALELVRKTFPEGSDVTLYSSHQKSGKYGRVIGDIKIDSVYWGGILLKAGLAVPEEWTDDEKQETWQKTTNIGV